ncbi:MAG TPA: replicative DNA helicase [Stellaceae bacterium]|jgi:replicative DNA helicase|nr:replicative DNA helicase [Stellaceae bacterium]
MVDAAPSNVTPLRDSDAIYRSPPQNLEAEQALLGAILVNNDAYRRVAEFLQPEHFAEPVHQRVYAAIRTLIERAQIANPVTLKNLFDQDGALAEIGGAQYLARLAASVVTIINATDYGRQIYDLHLRRQLISIGEDTVNDAYAYDLEREAAAQIEAAEKKLFDLATLGQYDSGFQPFKAALTQAITMAEAAFQKSGKTIGVATGFADLDKNLGGLHPSDLIVLAGRPSMGKTALATNIAFNAARTYRPGKSADGRTIAEDGAVVGFFSLEMSAEQLATRVLSEQSGVSSDRIRRGEVSSTDFDKFVRASLDLAEVPLFIDDTPALSITGLRTRARRLQRTHGLGLIVIDYLQLLRGSGDGPGNDNRVQEVSEITRGLKALAKELSVPVIALSQLSRQVESREDKKPMLSDLRESGSIEQDSDVVIFIYREEYYLSRSQPTQRPEEANDKFNERYERWRKRVEEVHDTAELLIAKQRHGPIGNITLRFDGHTTRFDNYVRNDHHAEERF